MRTRLIILIVDQFPHEIIFKSREGELEASDRVLMGTQDGKVALLLLDTDKSVRISWVLSNTASEVTSLDTFEIDNGHDVILGRQDGSVEIHTLPNDEETTPLLRFRYVRTILFDFDFNFENIQ